jgi:hypothetical protein
LAVSNSWLLLMPGVSFLLPTSRSICWSSTVNNGEVEQPFCANNCTVFWLGERIGDLTGDLIPPLPTLTWLTRWCSQTTSSSIYTSVLSLSAWCSVSILNKSDWPAGLRLTSDLYKLDLEKHIYNEKHGGKKNLKVRLLTPYLPILQPIQSHDELWINAIEKERIKF